MGEPERERPWSPWHYLHTRHPDVEVYETELAGDMLGCVDIAGRRMWIDRRLTSAEKRCTVAHELGHLERVCDPSAETLEERAVEEWAARRLVDVRALARALQWSADVHEIAEELWVDEHIVRARFRCLTDDEQDIVLAAIERMRVA